jgi:predicted AlkP superfamily phosphohydrolase/phosphomutase
MQRRDFGKLIGAAGAAALASGCGGPAPRHGPAASRRVYLVAFDGLDPRIARRLMDAGKLSNFARLSASGSFTSIKTSTPPHTPVAFSSIISGADPGLHQIFDFIHRDVNPPRGSKLVFRPYFSTADTAAPENARALSLGSWRLPLSSGHTLLLRRGKAFWDYLVEHGVDTAVYYVPSNYPPELPSGPGRFRAISGMGTPDLLGGYGEFTLFTPDAPRGGRQVGGGRFEFLSMLSHRGRAELVGPENYLRKADASGRVPTMRVPIDIVRDPVAPVARIALGGTTLLLNEGEWSGWVPLVFETRLPGSSLAGAVGAPTSVGGAVRLFLKQVHPKFELYVSPINIDPANPANPISVPAAFSQQLVARHGRFHTLGIPEDTKALSHGALSEEQFLAQTRRVLDERIEQYRAALADFKAGCLFFYFGDTDLVQHMFWRDRDPEHPGRDPRQGERFAQVVEDLYVKADSLVGELLKQARAGDTILVFSDHGFTTFRRGFNLNTWLADNGFLGVRPGSTYSDAEMFVDVDWAKTRAYGLGLNGLYLNLAGRERFGTLKSNQRRGALGELRDKLLEVSDANGRKVIERVDLVEERYPSADERIAPDLLVGYADGYRASWGTVLGARPAAQIEDNMDRWSGDHSIAANLVPGLLLTNRPITAGEPSISDLAPTALAAFGIAKPSQMSGRPLFAAS